MKSIFLLWVCMTVLFIGCTTKESDASNDAMDNNFTILRGTVPGTLIEAFCEDGSYYKTNSVKNGTSKHPFSLSIPKNRECYLVMITNENTPNEQVITHIAFNINGKKGPLFTPKEDEIDLGYIDLYLSRTDSVDINNDGVVDELYEVDLEDGVDIIYLDLDPLDIDGDGILNIFEDYDEDGLSNYYDDDDDNDGLFDREDPDDNNDGIEDEGYFIDYGYNYDEDEEYYDANESELL